MADDDLVYLRSGPVKRSELDKRHEDLRNQLMALLAGAGDFGGVTTRVANMAGAPGIGAWLQAAQDKAPVAGLIGTVANPGSVVGGLWDGLEGLGEAARDWWTGAGAEPPKLMSKDEFLQSRRPKRETLEEAVNRADTAARESDTYKQLVMQNRRTNAQRFVDSARKDAETTWQKGQGTRGAEEEALSRDYDTYRQGFDKELEEYHGRSFADRNPGLAKAAPALGTIASGLVAGGLFSKLAKTGKRYVDDAEKAWADGRMGDFARAADKAKKWDDGLTAKQAVSFGAAAGVPFELRALGDVSDRYQDREYLDSHGNWQRSRAQQQAEERLSDPLHYVADGVPAILSGLLGAGIGSKLARPAPRIEAKTMADGVSPERLAGLTAARQAEAKSEADILATLREVEAARRPSGPASGGPLGGSPGSGAGPTPAPMPGGGPRPSPSPQPQPIGGDRRPIGPDTTDRPDQTLPRRPDPSRARSYNPEIDTPISQQVLGEIFERGGPLPTADELVSLVRSRIPDRLKKKSVDDRAKVTHKRLTDRQRLGVDIHNPEIRGELIKQITGGTALGLAAAPLAGHQTREELLQQLFGGM